MFMQNPENHPKFKCKCTFLKIKYTNSHNYILSKQNILDSLLDIDYIMVEALLVIGILYLRRLS